MIIFIFLPLLLYLVIPALICVFIFPEFPYKSLKNPNGFNERFIRICLDNDKRKYRKHLTKSTRKLHKEVNKW